MIRAYVLVLAVLGTASVAVAQEAPAFQPRRIVISGGAALATGYPVGDRTVTMRRNAPGTPPFTVLRVQSDIDPAAGIEARIAYAVTGPWLVEASGVYASPDLSVRVTDDPEFSGETTAGERLTQFSIDVSAIYQLPVSPGGRMRPYAIAGAGYLRQLHEGKIMVETGRTLHAGAGLFAWLRGARDDRRDLGLRGELRYVHRSGGVEFDDRARGLASASLLLFVAF